MRELVPKHLVSQIFKLNLEMRLIIENKMMVPIIIKNKYGVNGYKVLLDMGKKNYISPNKMMIELKGKVDIEYLKYVGEVEITPIPQEPGYYKMQVNALYKVNERDYKRVPYRRAIKITHPIECDAILINLSGSGAMIQCRNKIEDEMLTMEFVLSKKNMVLDASIVEQKYDDKTESYYIRCYFDPIDKKEQKHIIQVVKEITLMAKQRLRGKS